MAKVSFHQILKVASQHKVSDIHFQVGSAPLLRHRGELVPAKHPPLDSDDVAFVCQHLSGVSDPETFKKEVRDLDGTFALRDVGRFRYNIFRQRGQYAAVLRVIPLDVLTFDALGLPSSLEKIASLPRGLVLVTGATGNGKSTTLAAMVEHINLNRRAHVITIEDPVEFLFDNKQAVVSQREVGSDTESFKSALRAALRQDPDVIMVGEMRDYETVDICLKAAETGHLVLSTIHTQDPEQTIGRLTGFFPPEEQQGIRQRLAETLMAVVSLRLLPKKGETTQLPACEIMMVTRTMQECIKHPEKIGEISEHIAKNRDLGMQTFNQCLVEMVRQEQITLEVAKVASAHPEELERDLTVE